jgi:hypothetical protein
MQFCEAIWSTSSHGDEITNDSFYKAVELIFRHENAVYERIFGELTNFQLKILKNVAQYAG